MSGFIQGFKYGMAIGGYFVGLAVTIVVCSAIWEKGKELAIKKKGKKKE